MQVPNFNPNTLRARRFDLACGRHAMNVQQPLPQVKRAVQIMNFACGRGTLVGGRS
jgi:hypothetical protein